jgi:hypothetical protein
MAMESENVDTKEDVEVLEEITMEEFEKKLSATLLNVFQNLSSLEEKTEFMEECGFTPPEVIQEDYPLPINTNVKTGSINTDTLKGIGYSIMNL